MNTKLTKVLATSIAAVALTATLAGCGKGSASSSDIKEAAKEETADKVYASYNVRSTPIVCVL